MPYNPQSGRLYKAGNSEYCLSLAYYTHRIKSQAWIDLGRSEE